MFASLKNKIKDETGDDVQAIPARLSARRSGRLSSSASFTSDDLQTNEHKDNNDIQSLRSQCGELSAKLLDLRKRFDCLEDEKIRIEKTNQILLESVKVAQNQKELTSMEQEKIQNLQQIEIEKLKNLLLFREQEGIDQLMTIKQTEHQIENLTGEFERLKIIEPMIEDLKDELEQLRRSSQLEKNNLTTKLAGIEEDNHHLKMRLKIVDELRLESIAGMNSDEKIQALVSERKLLEQHLEETHLQLSDVKSSWSAQNLALETQLNRLSRQVAEETTEKRKALKVRDEFGEKIKSLEFDLHNSKEEIKQRDDKIKLLEEEIDELNLALRDAREELNEEISCLKNKHESAIEEIHDLKLRLTAADERLNEFITNSDQVTQALRKQNTQFQDQLTVLNENYDIQKQEKITALLQNAEYSQSEEILKKDLRIERDENNELNDKNQQLQTELNNINNKLDEYLTVINNQKDCTIQIEKYQNELIEKNKAIKILNQRMTDLKKTLQNEIKIHNSHSIMDGNNSGLLVPDKLHEFKNGGSKICITKFDNLNSNNDDQRPIIMDEVNFKYLKHVIVKFLTSREVEAIHLIRAVATLLHLSNDEEKLLHDTLNWKMSWFGTKPVTVPSHFQQINN